MTSNNGKRIFKQYLIINNNGLRVNYGTTDRNNPSVLYIKAKGNIKPTIEKSTYADDIKELKKQFKHFFLKNLNSISNLEVEKYICNIEVSEKSLSYNKKGHFRYEIFIKPKEIRQLKQYENEVKLITDNVNQEISLFLKERGINAFNI